jgi:hypothetical protein
MSPESDNVPHTRLKRWQVVCLVVLALPLLVGLYWGARVVTGELLADDSPVPNGAAEGTSSTTAPPSPPVFECRDISVVDITGKPLPSVWLDQVRAVHDAACRRDYDALARQMGNPFRRLPPDAVVDEWRRDPSNTDLDVLVVTLETKGYLDQGGLLFCQRNGAYVVFARGTLEHPAGWNDFDVARNDQILLPDELGCG